MTCDTCGKELTVGAWPFCPHGTHGAYASIPDDIPGGQWFENGFETPRKFYNHSEHRRALKENGCQIAAKWAGPNDKHLINWAAAIDPYTLEAAKVLVTRGVKVKDTPRFQAPDPDVTLTVTRLDR